MRKIKTLCVKKVFDLVIYQTLRRLTAKLQQYPGTIAELETELMEQLALAGLRPEYFRVRRSEDLTAPKAGEKRLTILVAVWSGSID